MLAGPQRLTVRRRAAPIEPDPTEFTYATALVPA